MILNIYLWSVFLCATMLISSYFIIGKKEYKNIFDIGDEYFILAMSLVPIINTFLVVSFFYDVILMNILDWIRFALRFITIKIIKQFKK